jgi:hypothetical protein
MNARQFMNTLVSAGLEKYSTVRATLYLFPRFLFPEFLKATRLQIVERPFALAIIVYAIVFFLVFIVQAAFAYANDVLVPRNVELSSCLLAETDCLQFFLSDFANLFNYIILVQAYCVSGVFFLIYSNNVDRLLTSGDLAAKLRLSEPPPSIARGAFSVLFVIFFVTIGSVGYAIDVQSYPPHWYMNVIPESYPSFGEPDLALAPNGATRPFSGSSEMQLAAHYYYILINFLLLLFVGFVGVAHFGLFKSAGAVSAGLRQVYTVCDRERLELLADSKKINTWLAPLSTQIFISKIFVLSIVVNMTSWKMWEKSAGLIQDISIVIMVIVGIWIITLPRYFIQYHLFRIRKKCGIDEYRDIRMSWLLGASAFADLLLLSIAAKILFNAESIFEMLGSALAGG